LFNTTIMGIEDADALLIIGSNLRLEAPLINARVRKTWLRGALDLIGVVGEATDLTYAYEHVGAGPKTLADLAKGKGDFFKRFAKAERPMVIIGMYALARPDGPQDLKLASENGMKAKIVREGWNGWNVVHQAAGRVGALDLGFLPGDQGLSTAQMLQVGALDTLILLGADEVKAPAGTFVVYVGSHGDAGAQQADLILPAAAYTEKNATYVNTEGRVQRGQLAVYPPCEARPDWAIIRAFSAVAGKTLPYDSIEALRARLSASMRRAYNPAGVARQMLAIMASGDRRKLLRRISAPTLVVHGEVDPLVPIAAGRDTAANVPGAVFRPVPGMGHDRPEALLPTLAGLIADHCEQAG
jgi:NADH-quinone oxidoreductase subunit G